MSKKSRQKRKNNFDKQFTDKQVDAKVQKQQENKINFGRIYRKFKNLNNGSKVERK